MKTGKVWLETKVTIRLKLLIRPFRSQMKRQKSHEKVSEGRQLKRKRRECVVRRDADTDNWWRTRSGRYSLLWCGEQLFEEQGPDNSVLKNIFRRQSIDLFIQLPYFLWETNFLCQIKKSETIVNSWTNSVENFWKSEKTVEISKWHWVR